MNEIIVREALPDEYATVDALVADVYVGEGYTAEDRAAQLRTAAERAAHAELLVAVDDAGSLLGTVTVIPRGGPIAGISTEGEAEIRLLAVAPAARRRFVGAALVRDSIDRARGAGCSAVMLYTQPSMTAAHRLYERAGFVRAPERDFTNDAGVAMMVYQLAL